MPKIGVSYYSGSGNTQKMAEFVSHAFSFADDVNPWNDNSGFF